jgi:glycosyltransferase involved in cell wall biosynthesis
VIRGKLTRAVFTGRLSGYELAMAYASADIFFFPSASETFGCVTVEALASGLPCVVADGPGSRDIVRHDIDGFVCPPSDSEAFSLAIAQLIGDSALRARLAANAIERSRVYSWEVVLREMLSNFRRAAQRPFLS